MRLERLERARRPGRLLPENLWLAVGKLFPSGARSSVPDVRAAAGARGAAVPARGRRAAARADRARVRAPGRSGTPDGAPKARRREASAASEGPRGKRREHEHSHPGGAGAVLGTQLARFSSMQGLSLLLTNILHYASIPVVARLLGPGSRSAPTRCSSSSPAWSPRSSTWLSKPGTMMRTFGVSDDDDDDVEEDDEDEEAARRRPTYTLGVGMRLVRCSSAAVAIVLAFAFRTQIAEFLLHDPGQADAVVFATITGARLGDLQARRDGRSGSRAAALDLRADRRRPPGLQPDRDHRHPRRRRRA